jgi:hypothetical protein
MSSCYLRINQPRELLSNANTSSTSVGAEQRVFLKVRLDIEVVSSAPDLQGVWLYREVVLYGRDWRHALLQKV